MADETLPVVLASDAKILDALKRHHAAMKAFELVLEEVQEELSQSDVSILEAGVERHDACAKAMADLLNVRCGCLNRNANDRKVLGVGDLVVGRCIRCGAKIIIEGASHE